MTTSEFKSINDKSYNDFNDNIETLKILTDDVQSDLEIKLNKKGDLYYYDIDTINDITNSLIQFNRGGLLNADKVLSFLDDKTEDITINLCYNMGTFGKYAQQQGICNFKDLKEIIIWDIKAAYNLGFKGSFYVTEITFAYLNLLTFELSFKHLYTKKQNPVKNNDIKKSANWVTRNLTGIPFVYDKEREEFEGNKYVVPFLIEGGDNIYDNIKRLLGNINYSFGKRINPLENGIIKEVNRLHGINYNIFEVSDLLLFLGDKRPSREIDTKMKASTESSFFTCCK
ncbi:hypothetical protein ABK040_005821 [Willaertia magna]